MTQQQPQQWRQWLAMILVSFVLGTFLGGKLNASPSIAEVNPSQDSVTVKRPAGFSDIDLSLFWDVWSTLRSDYVFHEEIDDKALTYEAIRGLVDGLGDPYTGFLTPQEAKDFKANLNSELKGIGAELTIENDLLTIVSPLKNSPAEKAGIQPGDIIYKINDDLAAEFSLFDAVQAIRGPKGTDVTLTLIRAGVDEPFAVTITRDLIELESVTSEDLGEGIYLISINQFSDDTLGEFLQAVNGALLADAKGIILDLRYNGGGYLEITVDILGELIKPGKTAVIIESKQAQLNKVMETNGKARLADLPMVVLINGGSASASEIVAGALQDLGRGYLIGEQSFGKGTVQEVKDFPDGSTLRLTIARWLTPKKRDINKKGLTPDEVIELTEENTANDRDPQLDRAKSYLREVIN